MKFSKHYLEVAEYMHDAYKYSNECWIWREPICPNLGFRALKPFRTAFKPEDLDIEQRWYDDPCEMNIDEDKFNSIRDHRVFSLLIMHELAKDYESLLQSGDTEELLEKSK